MARVGDMIEGKYQILTMIGKGGMSEVYLAMDKNLNKQWAVKEIKKRARDKNNEVVVQSAIAEANLMKRLDHPCLPRIVDIIDSDQVIYVIMDYIEGEPLSKVLDRTGAQKQEMVIEWAKDLCGVLDYLHTQNPPIIYRDMKPANIMLQPNGNIKLIDFGIAREYKFQNLEDTVSLGTKGYAAPEQFGGKGQTDPRTDIYCLGVTLYHLVTGKNPCEPPYEIYPIRHWNPELSSGLESIILKCTALNPEDRYQSCAELMYALMHYEEADDAYKKKQSNKLKAFVTAAASFVLFLATGIGCQFGAVKATSDLYSEYLETAAKSNQDEDVIEAFEAAIALKPEEFEAYEEMFDYFKTNDGVFTIEEDAIIKRTIVKNAASTNLKSKAGYGKLAFDLGKLYWFYYDYGSKDLESNNVTRAKNALPWFADAVRSAREAEEMGQTTEQDFTYLNQAKAYEEIGEFYQNVTINIESGDERGTYAPYFDSLSELIEELDKEAEIVQLEVYQLCVFSMENYAKALKADGIEKEELEAFLSNVISKASALEPSASKTENMQKELLERETSAKKEIENAYAK